MFIKIFSLIVLVTIVATTVGIVIYLAALPGRTAKARHHPYADAVTVAGWVTVLAGGLLWPAALVWAYAGAPRTTAPVTADARQTPSGQTAEAALQ